MEYCKERQQAKYHWGSRAMGAATLNVQKGAVAELLPSATAPSVFT